jgi:TorA maturation chaperone TorD
MTRKGWPSFKGLAGLVETASRHSGLEAAIRAAGGIGALARALGVSQPAVSTWSKVPAERVLAVETLTGVSRSILRPDLYPGEILRDADALHDIDRARGQLYGLLGTLLLRAPPGDLLGRLSGLGGDATPLGQAQIGLAQAASAVRHDPKRVAREYFDLFVGVGRGELLPYASYYLTGFLHERPLARLREDMATLGVEKAENLAEPEDHIGILCEIMASLAMKRFEVEAGTDQRFFARHIEPFAARFFDDLAAAQGASFYRTVAVLGRCFIGIEAEAFKIAA